MDPRKVALLLIAVPAICYGQSGCYINGDQCNPSATIADVANAITAATPAPCTAPLSDTLTASAGTGTPCMARPDATRATQVQAQRASTDGNGAWSTTWNAAFASTPTTATATVLGGTPPYICSVTSVTTTTVAGKCYGVVATTLPSTLTAIQGLVVSPIANPGGGLTVMIVGRL